MKLEYIIATVIRIVAILIALYVIRGLLGLPPLISEEPLDQAEYLYIGIMIVFLCAAMIFWKFPLTIARVLARIPPSEQDKLQPVSLRAIEVLGFNILGLYLLFGVISDAIYWLSIWFARQRMRDIPYIFSLEEIASIVATLAELVFVVVLLFGGRGLARLFREFRYGKET